MDRKDAHGLRCLALVAAMLGLLAVAPAARAQWQIATEDGNSSIKFGFLMQGRAEFLDDAAGENTQKNLFFRRLRLLAGGKLNDQLSFFFETDSPNLGKAGADGTKNAGDLFIQDFVVTWKPQSDAFNLDVGMLLIETSHNSNQSAVSLMATDYGPYSFVSSGPIDARVGRDYGIRARGYLADDHLEYRAGVYQGKRGEDADNPFRYAGRLVYNVFQAEKGLFYSGTSLGTKHILSFGASYDAQDDYSAYSGDVFWDQPLPGGDAITLQGDWIHYDGDVFLPTLPKQDDLLIEAGYYNKATKLLPFIQYSERDFDSAVLPDDDKLQVGLGYMFLGHKGNLKLSWAQLGRDGAPDRDEIWLNFQVFYF